MTVHGILDFDVECRYLNAGGYPVSLQVRKGVYNLS